MEITHAEARKNLARLLERVTDEREIIFIRRRGREPVALVAADELAGLIEATHLLRSPKNATRLLGALRRALGRSGCTQSVPALRRQLGLGRKAQETG